MKLAYISSLDENVTSGGAHLRITAIKRIYQLLGLDCDEYYNDWPKNTFSLLPYLQSLYYGKQTRILFKRKNLVIKDTPIIHLDNIRQFYWLDDPKSFLIYNAHNLEFENFYGREESSFKRRFEEYELDRIAQSDLTMVCSERERSILLAKRPKLSSKIITVPNLINKDHYQAYPQEEKKTILFVGTLDYFPNIKAVEYLCREFDSSITPAHQGNFEFVIAGRNPTQEVREMVARSNFILKENLSFEQMKDLFAKTYLHLVPLMHGSGTRLKIVEAIFSKGLVLSTPLGREGIQSQNIIEAPIENFSDEFLRIMNHTPSFDESESEYFQNSWDIDSWFKDNEQILRDKLPPIKA